MTKQFIIDPPLLSDVRVGTEGDGTEVYLGRVAETGKARKVFFSGSQEFVTLIIGKRGSGKSHTLGTLVEGLATRKAETSISSHKFRRAVLLLDPMGNFWTTAHAVRSNGPEKVRAQFESLEGWRCKPEDVDVDVWLPAGYEREHDPKGVRPFQIRVSDLDEADLADLVGVNLMRDAQGAALAEAYAAVVEEGWRDGKQQHPAKTNYEFEDLINYLENLKAQNAGDHHTSTLRALTRSLRALARKPVFSGAGTPLTELLREGALSILMLPLRVGGDLRRVLTRLLIRRVLKERELASQIRQRLDVESLEPDARAQLEEAIKTMVPRSIIALDEAQELLGDDGGEARRALEDFCLLGRNYGLSLILATQRPTASAISSKVRSQADLYVIHRLLTQDDIDLCCKNLLAVFPKEVRDGNRDLDFANLVRGLERGQAIVSASHAFADEPVHRIFVAQIRPRITMHGGEVA